MREAQRTPDLTSLAQEVVDRLDWQPGNAMAFVITGTEHVAVRRLALSHDTWPPEAPLLVVEFEATE